MVDTKLIAAAGEHWVCSMLARCGWAAALTREGLGRTDILAVLTTGAGRVTVEVQVKTHIDTGAPPERPCWWMNTSAQKCARSEHEWFALVLVPEDTAAIPRTFVVPRDHAVAATWIGHMTWANDPTAPPGKRNPNNLPRIAPLIFERYEKQWDLLTLPTTEVPILLPPHYRELAQQSRIGLPNEHPWSTRLPEWS